MAALTRPHALSSAAFDFPEHNHRRLGDELAQLEAAAPPPGSDLATQIEHRIRTLQLREATGLRLHPIASRISPWKMAMPLVPQYGI